MEATTSSPEGTPPAGWYADPSGGPSWRWWDGSRWTEHVAPAFTQLAAVADRELLLDQGSGITAGLGGGENRVMAGDALVGLLVWGGMKNRVTGDATFVTPDGAWFADHRGVLDRKVHLSVQENGQGVGIFSYSGLAAGTGTLTLVDGRAFTWTEQRSTGGPRITIGDVERWTDWGHWHLGAADGRSILWARTHSREGHRVQLSPEARDEPHLSLLVVLSLYLITRWKDAQASRRGRTDSF